jgi:hypothetical protein
LKQGWTSKVEVDKWYLSGLSGDRRHLITTMNLLQ